VVIRLDLPIDDDRQESQDRFRMGLSWVGQSAKWLRGRIWTYDLWVM